MVDENILSQFTDGERSTIRDAFKILASSGMFLKQVAANVAQLTEGFQNAEPLELTKRIMEVQQTNRQLLALHELMADYEGKTNA